MAPIADVPNSSDLTALVTRAVQQEAYYCGAACSVMVLAKYGATVLQSDAYNSIRNDDQEPDAYYTDPAGITGFLNSPGAPDTLRSSLQAFSTDQSESVCTRLINNIQSLGIPSPVLVNGGAHWVVIDGLRIVSEAGSTTLLGAYIVDPSPTEVARKYVASDVLFQAPYITGSQYGTVWKGRLVVIAGTPATPLRVVLAHHRALSPTAGLVSFATGVRAPIEVALSQLTSQGFSGVKAPSGGGGPNSAIKVTGVRGDEGFTLTLVDATENASFANLIYVAIGDNGVLLEVASDASQVIVLDDSEVKNIVQSKYPDAESSVVAGYFWMSKSILRSRFSLVRKVVISNSLLYVLSSGEIVSDLSLPPVGGGLTG